MGIAAIFSRSLGHSIKWLLIRYGIYALVLFGLLVAIAWNDGPAEERIERLYDLSDAVFRMIAKSEIEFDRRGNIFRGARANYRREGYGELSTPEGFLEHRQILFP